jgi:hypothetical protein
MSGDDGRGKRDSVGDWMTLEGDVGDLLSLTFDEAVDRAGREVCLLPASACSPSLRELSCTVRESSCWFLATLNVEAKERLRQPAKNANGASGG